VQVRNNDTGFTLIELVIVIVILGILAAAALPRFSDLAGDARTASVNGVAGALRAASSVAHATQLAQGLSQGAAVNLEGVSINMSNGYPNATTSSGSIASALTDFTGFTLSLNSSSLSFTVTGRTGGTCTAEYNNAPNSTTAATVSVNTTGCAN
jgi:MSHA pilin protein MshA